MARRRRRISPGRMMIVFSMVLMMKLTAAGAVGAAGKSSSMSFLPAAFLAPRRRSPHGTRTTIGGTRRNRFVTRFASSTNNSKSPPSDHANSPHHNKFLRTTPSEDERPEYPKGRRPGMESLATSSTASERPGAIIEDEQQLATKARILQDIRSGQRTFTNAEWLQEVFGEDTDIPDDDDDDDDDEDGVEDDDDDDDADLTAKQESKDDASDPDLDAERLGTWTIEDIRSKFEYEWDPSGDDPDPNLVSLNRPNVRYVETPPPSADDPNVERGYDPIFGPSSPIDRRTILGAKDSYMVDPTTRDDQLLRPQFAPKDPELEFNQEVVELRQAMDIMETFIDPFLPDMEIPRHVAKWHGYPEMQFFEPKPFENNRFTSSQDRTNFATLDPHRARQRAVELARAKNAEWLPSDVSYSFHEKQRAPYEAYQTLVGTLRRQEEPFDEDLLEQIQPALQVFGSSVELLSIHDGVFRFHYHGLMKNRHGMTAWMTSLLREECGVDPVTGVVMETGFRQRDAAYDGGDPWYAPIA